MNLFSLVGSTHKYRTNHTHARSHINPHSIPGKLVRRSGLGRTYNNRRYFYTIYSIHRSGHRPCRLALLNITIYKLINFWPWCMRNWFGDAVLAQHAGSASHRVLLFDAPCPQNIYVYLHTMIVQYMRVISMYEIEIHDMAQVQHNSQTKICTK